MPLNHPLSVAGRLLTTTVFSCLVAIALTLAGHARWDTNLAYALPIGLISWLAMEAGRAWLTRHSTVPWPRGIAGWLLVAFGTGVGFAGGSAMGRWYVGGPGAFWQGISGPGAASTLVITAAASVVMTFYFHSRAKARALLAQNAQAQRDAAQARLQLLQAQLEPHMLFNTLANLRVLVGTDPARAQDMLDHLIDYLRATLGASRTTVHPLSDEFARVADYLALMAVRMGPRLSHALDLPDPLRALPVPALLLQPLVENAIRHGLEPLLGGGRITVQACLVPATGAAPAGVQLRVTDTGAGLHAGPDGTRAPVPAHAPACGGFGLQLVRDRLATLYGDRAGLALRGLAPHGTCAEVFLPLSPPLA